MSVPTQSDSYCAGCGTVLPADARFCTACGRARSGARGGAAAAGAVAPAPKLSITAVAVFAAVVAAGGYAWLRSNDPAQRAVPGSPTPAASAPASPGDSAGGMPADHPPLELPPEARAFLDDLEKKAKDAPQDIEAWRKLARARYRASMLDRSFEPGAREALAHILEIDPKDAEAVRMSANIEYENRQFAEAEKWFRRYLEIDAADAGVRTDLASSVLFQKRVDEALAMYRAVLADHPDFVQAHVNLGIALHGNGQSAEAMKSFQRARELTTDPDQIKAIDEIVAMAEGRATEKPPASAPPAPAGAPATNAKTAFQKGVDALLGAHAIVSPKIKRIDWTGDATAAVHLANFPMDSMPPVVRNKFKSTMNGKIAALATENALADVRVDLVDDADGRVMDTLDGKELIGAFDQPQDH